MFACIMPFRSRIWCPLHALNAVWVSASNGADPGTNSPMSLHVARMKSASAKWRVQKVGTSITTVEGGSRDLIAALSNLGGSAILPPQTSMTLVATNSPWVRKTGRPSSDRVNVHLRCQEPEERVFFSACAPQTRAAIASARAHPTASPADVTISCRLAARLRYCRSAHECVAHLTSQFAPAVHW